MLLILGVVCAVIGVHWTRKTEVIVHDPLDGIKPSVAQRLEGLRPVLQALATRPDGGQAAQDEDEGEDDGDDFDRQEVIDLIRSGRHIEALKLYREATGADLSSAMAFIDALRRRLN